MDITNVSFDNYLNVCRFCLMPKDSLQKLSAEEVPTSQIAALYKTLMDVEVKKRKKFFL